MRVLLVSQFYWPEPVPKPHELAEGLAAHGHEVTVITGFPCYPGGRLYPGFSMRLARAELQRGVRIIRVPLYPSHGRSVLGRVINFVSYAVGAAAIGPFLSGPVDVVYVWGNPPTSGLAGLLIGWVRGAPVVYGVHDLWPDVAEASGMVRARLLLRVVACLERFVQSKAVKVVVIGDGFRKRLIERGVPPERVAVIPHWADEELFRPLPRDEALAERLRLQGRFVVMYAGNVGRLQGLERLLQLANRLRRDECVRFVIVGDGIERERLEHLAREQGLDNVMFAGRQPASAVSSFCSVADVLYVGLADAPFARLSMPSKVATYMACGKPILSTVLGDTAALLAVAGCGVTVDGDDSDAMMAALKAMREMSQQERVLIGDRGRRYFEQALSKRSLLGRYVALFASLEDGSAMPRIGAGV